MSLKRERKFAVPRCGHQPTGFCGFLAASLIGQTCSSCCWTERHYWFSTQRTRRLHRCPMTWPTGYRSPVDLCPNAAERTKTTQYYGKKTKTFLVLDLWSPFSKHDNFKSMLFSNVVIHTAVNINWDANVNFIKWRKGMNFKRKQNTARMPLAF